MLGFKNFLMEEDGVGVVEMVLIVVVVEWVSSSTLW